MIKSFVNEVLQHQHFEVLMDQYYGEDAQFGQHLLTKVLAYHVENFKNRNVIRANE